MANSLCYRIAPADVGQRLDHYLVSELASFSRARIQQWIEDANVRVNGGCVKASYRLREADLIEVEPAAVPPLKAVAEAIPLVVLYEDADVVAIHKPAGMVVHAGAGVREGTMVNALLHRYAGELSTGSAEERPGIVHRLDRFTSGVILVARNDHAHQSLAAQFAARTIEKHYLALVHGELKEDTGTIEKAIGRDPVHRARMSARVRTGRSAFTEWTVLRRFAGYTFLDLRIGTGRTHQIRVHLASIGHPVVGDRLYGAPSQPDCMPAPERYFLHARRIAFTHPRSGERIEVVAPLTPDIEDWMRLLAV